MEKFTDLPLDVRLSAYLDGQTSESDATELEALIASNNEARRLFDQLMIGSDFGTKAFNKMLDAPVPLKLVRAIKDAAAKANTENAPVLKPANNNRLSWLPRTIAASAILLLAGGYSGYFLGQQAPSGTSHDITEVTGLGTAEGNTKTRSFKLPGEQTRSMKALPLDQVIAGYYRVYSDKSAEMVEIPANEADRIRTTLAGATGIEFDIPDLTESGFQFKGARLLAANGQPMGTLFYQNAKGETLMAGFSNLNSQDAQTMVEAPLVKIEDTTVGYVDRYGMGIIVVAPTAVANFEKLLDEVKAQL